MGKKCNKAARFQSAGVCSEVMKPMERIKNQETSNEID